MLKDLLKIAAAFALQFLIRDHYYATEVRKSELSRATLSFFPKTKCPIFAYPNDSTAKSTIEPPFRMLNFIKNLHIFSILIICIILDLVYGSATSLWFWRPLQSHLCYTPMNWASWIRTSKYSSQSAVPYHLAIAQKFFYILNMRDFTKNIFHI